MGKRADKQPLIEEHRKAKKLVAELEALLGAFGAPAPVEATGSDSQILEEKNDDQCYENGPGNRGREPQHHARVRAAGN